MTEDPQPKQDLAAKLGAAVSEFRSAVERQAWVLLAAAERRAEDRERDAAKLARRTVADAERNAERILQAALERTRPARPPIERIGLLGIALLGSGGHARVGKTAGAFLFVQGALFGLAARRAGKGESSDEADEARGA